MLRVLKYCLLVVIGFGLTTATFAQTNLVRNGSFEEREPNFNGDSVCPSSGGDIGISKFWLSGSGSVDYFHSCSNEHWPNFGVPFNLYGYQETFGGRAYAQVACFALPWPNAREYLMQELEEPLRSGQGYYLRFRISLADSINFAVSNIGAFFSEDDARFWDDEQFFHVEPVVESPDQIPVADKVGWTEVSGQFVANGTERYLLLGCFKPDSVIEIERVSDYPQTEYSWEASAYLIDGVELYEDNSIGVLESAASKIMVYPNPAENLLTVESGNSVLKSIEILDLRGAVLIQKPAAHKRLTLDVGTLLPGIYLLKATTTDAEVFTTRLVKV